MKDIISDMRTPNKVDRLVVGPSLKKGEYDSHTVDCPFVFRHGDRYYMTVVGWDTIGYQTGLASSADLLHWESEGMILGRGPKGYVTEYNAALTSIIRDNELHGPGTLKKIDGRYVGTYHAYPEPGLEAGPAIIGICYSDDLRTWEVGGPALTPDANCEWEAGGLYKSWVMEHDGTFYIFYNAKNQPAVGNWIEQTGFATSTDLVNWQKHPGNPVIKTGPEGSFEDVFASDPCVLRHEGVWVMFYYTLSTDGYARDSVAFSDDLITWEKSGEILIDVGPPGSIDSRYAHKPAVLGKDGVVYHFYCATAPAEDPKQGEIEYGEVRGIGVACS